VIVPGFMCGHQQYADMAESMAARGVPVAVVPLEWYHWLPTMSTNSYRPILDAIDHTVQHPPAEEMASKIALVAHSAGGWLSRLYLSQKAHYGRTWDGAKLVNRLVTLGSPHVARLGPMAPHVARANDDGGALPVGVRCLTVASKGIRGKVSAMARASYHICAGPWANVAELDGDGITTADAALSVGGADKLVLEGVNHMPRS
ncbi:hypothetical protein EMIHUDRAFT_45403, partial [Emiliania huxleyi CCMP1516]|uniref:GPI inositol-deacylase n=2 Tax=Emiliania huxleyi TaxID=2903 RepID=A0A0D3K836_EMIH1